MADKFALLPNEKRLRVLAAALREFGRKGYDGASTNVIAAEAEIAKGSVFVYFGSKKEMYLYGVRWAMDVLHAGLFGLIDFGSGDFFIRASQIRGFKLALFSQYPYLADFLRNMVQETSPEVAENARLLWGGVVDKMRTALLEGLDKRLFRGDIPFPRILEILQSIISAYEQKVRAAAGQSAFDGAFLAEWDAEWNELVAVMRRLFYRGGDGL